MLKLHGFPYSNYHNVVKVVLMEKDLAFEEVVAYPPPDNSYRTRNPTGKYPCLEIEDGVFLGETKVIMNYLEEVYPDRTLPLLPDDPLGRARVRELMEIIDLYLEMSARRLYPEVFSSHGRVSEEVKEHARPLIARGIDGLKQLAKFDPYIAGSELTLADFSATFHFAPVTIACEKIYGEDLLAEIPAIARHRALMDERPCVRQVRAEQLKDQKTFMARPS